MVHPQQLRFAAVLRGTIWVRAVACVMWESGMGEGGRWDWEGCDQSKACRLCDAKGTEWGSCRRRRKGIKESRSDNTAYRWGIRGVSRRAACWVCIAD